LEKATNDDRVASLARGLALYSIYYQRRDAETMVLMRNYEKHEDENIQKYAKDAIKSLQEHYKIPYDVKAEGAAEVAVAEPEDVPEVPIDALPDVDEETEELVDVIEEAPVKGSKAKPAGPVITGQIFARGFAASDIQHTELMLNIQKDGLVLGSFKGLRDGKRFLIMMRGKVDSRGTLVLRGQAGQNNARIQGKLSKQGAAGSLEGAVFQKNFAARFNAPK
jgi:hypothetical protein